ncbi:MAG: S41 family peptidase [Bacteroidota bacterium]
MKFLFLPVLLLISIQSFGQNELRKFNLNFETNIEGESLPKNWRKWGDYQIIKDSTIVYSGKFSSKITADSESSFGSIAYKIPSKYQGKAITLEGYMRLKNVTNGFVGLLMRLDGNGGVLQFDNMQSRGISGTRDWQKYQITLPYDHDTESIYVAGILQGRGTAWFDSFKVTIDGKDIQTLKEVEKTKTQGSNVVFADLNEGKITDLELLGRIWGFLKYHHPVIATGNYNWDLELFRFLPKYLDAETIEVRNHILLNWIASYGKVEPCEKCPPVNSNAYLRPNFKWFKQYELSRGISKQLSHIQKNRFQGSHYYIDFAPNVGNPKFKNERSYGDIPYPDAGFRLLTLYRLWNMVEYYFPYKHLTDVKWSDVLPLYITAFIDAKDELEFEIATLKLIGEIGDTHANLWGGNNAISNIRGEFYPPFHVRFIENKAVVSDFYNSELQEASKIQIGDIILAINGRPIEEIVKARAKYYPASNHPTKLRDIGEELLRSTDSSASVTYKSEGVRKKDLVKLYRDDNQNRYKWYRKDPNGKSYWWLNEDIAYITLKNIKPADIGTIKEDFLAAKGIVMDIRNYPSYFVPFALGSFFVEKSTPFVRFTVANNKTPGEFLLERPLKIQPGRKRFKGKLVVLVNELSQSQAEYTAMAFRASPKCTIIGSTTAAADGNVSAIPLPGGMRTMISGIGVHYPDGSETQRIGIVPDIEVHPTIAGIKSGKDELLEKAIELINKK